MKIRLALSVGLLAAFLCASVQSQTYRPFPGASEDERTLRIQERVEELYAAGEFKRAFFIYENELAPIGDKYAQYMVGFMQLNAQGTAQDNISALAWYRIAAERREPVLQQARDQLKSSMTPQEIALSNRVYLDLWQSIGDTRLVLKLIRKDMDTLKARTGSRIGGSATSGPTLVFSPSGEPLSANYYRNVRVRLEARLNFLETKVEISDVALESEDEALKLLQDQVREELAALDIP